MAIINVAVNQIGSTTSQGIIRQHTVLIDRPESKGGADEGAMGGELLLASLGGCFMSNLLAAIAARQAEVSDVRIDIAGALEGTPPRFTAVSMAVTATYADEEQMQKLITIAERGCIVANTLKDAVEVSISLV